MKKTLIFATLSIFLVACTAQQIKQAQDSIGDVLNGGELTTAEVASGLKAALEKGTTVGAQSASRQDGYFGNPLLKIPFPPDVKKVETKLRQVGLGKEVDKFILTLNRGAEEAAKEAKPIFVAAIRNMTITDAWNILKGRDNAATEYLRRTTSTELKNKFSPVISRALDKTQATKYYGTIINAYNKIPLTEDVNPDLNEYATQKAVDGLFILIAKEEKNIRENPLARTTEILKKVFSRQDS